MKIGKDYIPTEEADPVRESIVPCGTCTACCQNDAIFIYPDAGDDPDQYQTVMYKGMLMLDHKDNGDCVYLDRKKGCTIWERRPTRCREFDCRLLVMEHPQIYKRMASPEVIKAGKKRLKRLRQLSRNKRNLSIINAKKTNKTKP